MDDFYSQPKGKDFWGPPIWTAIHVLALIFPSGTGSKYSEFLKILTHILPCEECKTNLEKKLKSDPPDFYISDNEKAFFYSYKIHDAANENITKYKKESPKISPPFEVIKKTYIESLMKSGPKFWGPPIWTMLHILAAVIRPSTAVYYKKLLNVLYYLLPTVEARENLNTFLKKYPIDPYLRNNNDCFFYSYILHSYINSKIGNENFPQFFKIKSFYFNSLGEECNDCKL